MSERTSPWPFSDKEQIAKAERIGNDALGTIDRTYGGGYPHWSPGATELAYHNGHHARAVGEGAVKLCVALGLDSIEQAIALTAGRAHDIVQLKGRGIDESESADWLEVAMREQDIFPPARREMGRLAILGTEPLFRDGKIIGQKATQLAYPSKTAEQLAMSVASADMGELYIPEGPYMGHQLFRELQGMPSEDEPAFEDLIRFQRSQVALLETYTYPLRQANRVLATHRLQVIKYGHAILRQLESGTIESWDQLLQKDQDFIRQHR